ncbi:MAG TPA: sulfurtransferase TusA family protein [Burkholderiaceae bacterium]|nr:sulfurtransferase TusA family protein [Burkholderiaceae bacterium]
MADRKVIDARGYSCTGPLMELIAELKLAAVGEEIEVLSVDPDSATEISQWVQKVRHEFLGATAVDGVWRSVVRKTH